MAKASDKLLKAAVGAAKQGKQAALVAARQADRLLQEAGTRAESAARKRRLKQTLAKAGLLVSHAGTNGGYALARKATEITAFEVIRAIDGPLFITSCITIHGACDLTSTCTIKEPLRKVNDSIKDLLSGLHISDLVEADGEQVGSGAPVGGGLVSIAV